MKVSLEKMSVNDSLVGKDFLTLADYTANEVSDLLELAAHLKRKQKLGQTVHPLKGKVLGMIFEKPSTRTRVSFETGMYKLGGDRKSTRLNSSQVSISLADLCLKYTTH